MISTTQADADQALHTDPHWIDWSAWRDFSTPVKSASPATSSLSRPNSAWASGSASGSASPSPPMASKTAPHEWSTPLRIDGMHCAACALRVEETLACLEGVLDAQVNFTANTARVRWTSGASTPQTWAQALEKEGYRASPLNLQEPQAIKLKEHRLALWRMLVSGFCMMQIMMYSVPSYLAKPEDITPDMQMLLRWASWVLALPVLLFACGPFWRSAWTDLKEHRISMELPVALGIAITFGVSTWCTFSGPALLASEVYFDSMSMFVFFLLVGRWLELKLKEHTTGSLEALMNKMPQTVEKRTPSSGVFKRVNVSALEVGDLIRVMATEVFPCDAQVLHGQSWVEEALLSGESKPLSKGPGDQVLAGSHNLSQALELHVTKVGQDTRYAQIIELMMEASFNKPRMVRIADQVAKPFLWAVLLAALFCAVFWWDQGPSHALMIAVSVLIVTCPCALSLAAPVALLASAGNLARHGIFIRNLHSLEVLAKTQTVVFDKTGTLTQDRQTIERILTPSGEVDDANITANQRQALLCALGLSQSSWHPVSRTLMADLSFKLALTDTVSAMVSDGTGFNSIREFAGQGLEGEGHLMGLSAQTPAPMNTPYRLGSLEFCASLSPPPFIPYGAQNAQVHLVGPSGWMASFVLSEDIRADAQKTLTQLHSMNNAVFLLSGDRQTAVTHVAQQIGLEAACVHSRMSPRDKLDFVATRQALGEVVATVGDGFNDLPAMAKTDVSIAFGKAIPITQSRADVVVLSEELWAVPLLLALSQKTMTIIRQNLLWAALYNFTCVPLAVMGYFPAWAAGLGMAASSLWVVFHASQLAKDRTLITPGPIPRRHATQRLDSVHP